MQKKRQIHKGLRSNQATSDADSQACKGITVLDNANKTAVHGKLDSSRLGMEVRPGLLAYGPSS